MATILDQQPNMSYRNLIAAKDLYYLKDGVVYKQVGAMARPITTDEAMRVDPTFANRFPGVVQASKQQQASKPKSLPEQMADAQNAAKSANESRYSEIKKGYEDRYARNMADVAKVGDQQNADIRSAYGNRMAQMNQNLAARGLSGTTIAPTMAMGNTREMNADLNRSNEGLTQQRVGLDAQLSGDTLQFMERREDTYPDMQQYLALQQGLGRGGATTTVTRSGPQPVAQAPVRQASIASAYRAPAQPVYSNMPKTTTKKTTTVNPTAGVATDGVQRQYAQVPVAQWLQSAYGLSNPGLSATGVNYRIASPY